MSKPFEIKELLGEISYILNKKSAKGSSDALGPKKIFLVEKDEDISGKIAVALLNRGLTVNLAHSGADAIERISKDVPDIVCVNMNLPDITGEVVIQKLKRMAKTSGIKTLLYAYDVGMNEEITNKIQNKEGIDKYVEISTEMGLVDEVHDLLK